MLRGPSVVDSGLLDWDRADAGLDGPLGEVAIADHLLTTGGVLEPVFYSNTVTSFVSMICAIFLG